MQVHPVTQRLITHSTSFSDRCCICAECMYVQGIVSFLTVDNLSQTYCITWYQIGYQYRPLATNNAISYQNIRNFQQMMQYNGLFYMDIHIQLQSTSRQSGKDLIWLLITKFKNITRFHHIRIVCLLSLHIDSTDSMTAADSILEAICLNYHSMSKLRPYAHVLYMYYRTMHISTCRRIPISEVPSETEQASADWLIKLYQEKVLL